MIWTNAGTAGYTFESTEPLLAEIWSDVSLFIPYWEFLLA